MRPRDMNFQILRQICDKKTVLMNILAYIWRSYYYSKSQTALFCDFRFFWPFFPRPEMVCSAVHPVEQDILVQSSPNLAHVWSKDVGRCDINWSCSCNSNIEILSRSRFMTFWDWKNDHVPKIAIYRHRASIWGHERWIARFCDKFGIRKWFWLVSLRYNCWSYLNLKTHIARV